MACCEQVLKNERNALYAHLSGYVWFLILKFPLFLLVIHVKSFIVDYDRRDQDHFRQRNGGRKEPVADDSNERTEDSLSDMNDQSKASEPGGRRQASRLVQSKPQTNTSNGGDTPTLTPSNEKRPKRELLTYQTNDDEFDF